MKICQLFLVLLTLACSVSCAALTVYNNWKLTPDAEAKLEEFSRAGANCRLKKTKPNLFPGLS